MLPRLAIVSTGIRRDLLAPLKYFSKFEIIHFYRRAEYGDLTPEDLGVDLLLYRSPRDLYRQLVRAQPVIIQAVEPFSIALQPYLWACYFAAERTHARLLAVTLENRPLKIKFGRALAFALRHTLKKYFARACLIIALNHGAQANLESCGVATSRIERLMWGTWGVEVDEFSPQPAPRYNEPAQGRGQTILFVGRLVPEKGIFILLEAFARLRQKIAKARLVVVGDGPARRAVEGRVRELDLQQVVTLTGAVKNRALLDFFRAADVFAAPSLTTPKWAEQVGMSALQALACGVPVVTTRSGAIPEYVPDGVAGWLVAENDARALADALTQLLTDETLRSDMGRAAREYALEHYAARVNIRRAEQVLEERCLASSV